MLQISGLKAGYDGMEVLKGIDLDVGVGEIAALIGPNGAGKTTVLKSIFSLCEVSSGKILFKGKDISRLQTHELILEGITYVPQGRHVFSDLTVRENLEMGAFVVQDKEIIRRNLEDVLQKFPFLGQKQDDYAFTLSGGQQQLLVIARALMQNPQLMLLDEPSLGLSPKMMKEVFGKIVEINREGVGMLIVEQNAKQAVQISRKTYVLEEGKVALSGGKEILKNRKVKSIYFGGN